MLLFYEPSDNLANLLFFTSLAVTLADILLSHELSDILANLLLFYEPSDNLANLLFFTSLSVTLADILLSHEFI